MKKFVLILSLAITLAGISSAANASLESFLKNVNVQAKTDMKNFSIKLSTQFGVPISDVDAIVKVVANPSDAYMVFQLGHMAHKEPGVVLEQYQRDHGKGWGKLAQELGIKPGSKEFHALKRGNLHFTGERHDEEARHGHGHSKSKSHGNEKGHGNGKGRSAD